MKNLALMSAIALTSAVGFTACSSSDDVTQDTNPTYDGSSVRTDFAFSISSGAMGTTRMTGENTLQADNSFKGMKDMYLLPFSLGTGNEPANNTSTNISTSTGKNFPLGSLSGITEAQSSKVYSLSLPVGTDNFLFYGTVDNSEVTLKTKRGSLTSSLANTIGNTDDISFSLVPISANLGDDQAKLEAYLSNIAKANIGSASDDQNWWYTPTKAQTDGTYSALATLYTNFTTIGETRAGSAECILRTVLDLYRTAKGVIMVANAPAPNEEANNVYKIAQAICNAITSGDGTSGCYKVTITETAPVSPATIAPETWTAAWSGLTNTTFPRNLQLPMGAAQLTYNTTSHTFSYKTNPNYVIETAAGVALTDITYPAELIYFDNSPLRATNSYKTEGDFPKTVAKWDADLGTAGGFSSDWSGTRVEPSTRAVAMQNNVNYGVALLQTQIKMAAGIASNMIDNMKGLYPSALANQTNIDGTKFEVTGILIGGQPKSVGWDMTNPGLPVVTSPAYNGREVFQNVIYDQDIPFNTTENNVTTYTPIPVGSLSAPIYTLVLDNYTATNSETQKPVRFALELVNKSGKDFYGAEGMIPNGHTFYLCGELNPSATSGVTPYTKAIRSNSYRITKEDKQRVFMQDYKTIAEITISNDALQKAYSSIPDLRATEILFGLSVDLKWESGVKFNVEL